LTTKIHALVDALGNPVEVMLSPGQDHDLTCAQSLIEAVDPGALIADKAFDADAFIAVLNSELADLGVQPLDLPLMRRLRVPSDARVEGARRLVQKLLLPGVNLVGMDLVPLRQVDNRRLLPQGLQRDLRLQPRVDPASRVLRHRSLRLSNGAAGLQLNPRSQKRGPLHCILQPSNLLNGQRAIPLPLHRAFPYSAEDRSEMSGELFVPPSWTGAQTPF